MIGKLSATLNTLDTTAFTSATILSSCKIRVGMTSQQPTVLLRDAKTDSIEESQSIKYFDKKSQKYPSNEYLIVNLNCDIVKLKKCTSRMFFLKVYDITLNLANYNLPHPN